MVLVQKGVCKVHKMSLYVSIDKAQIRWINKKKKIVSYVKKKVWTIRKPICIFISAAVIMSLFFIHIVNLYISIMFWYYCTYFIAD